MNSVSYIGDIGWLFFIFDDTATTAIYTYLHTLSLHDALPICRASHRGSPDEIPLVPTHGRCRGLRRTRPGRRPARTRRHAAHSPARRRRSEEHTSELQSLMRSSYAVFCLNKKNSNT